MGLRKMFECPKCDREFDSKLGLGNHRSAKHTQKYDNKDWLKQKYVDEGMNTKEIADMFGVSDETIRRRLRKMDVKMRTVNDYTIGEYQDKETLRELYVESELSIPEISNRFDCCTATVMKYVNKFGFEKRGRTIGERKEYANYWTDKNGYERWLTAHRDTTEHIFVHTLLAISEYGIDAVKGKVVHHDNEIPWDNRPGNIELMDRGEHTAYHNRKNRGV